MLARSRASEAIAPPVIPSVSMCVTIRTRGDARTRSAISWATASIGPSTGRRVLESLGEAREWRRRLEFTAFRLLSLNNDNNLGLANLVEPKDAYPRRAFVSV